MPNARLLLALLLLAPAAAAQTPKGAPFDISAPDTVVRTADCSMTWSGGVEALQGTSRLRADTLTRYDQKLPHAKPGASACGDLDRLEAHGHVYYASPERRVHGQDAVYRAGDHTLTVTGGVTIAQGRDVAEADRVVVDTVTGDAQLQSDPSSPGRVRMVIFPKADADLAAHATH